MGCATAAQSSLETVLGHAHGAWRESEREHISLLGVSASEAGQCIECTDHQFGRERGKLGKLRLDATRPQNPHSLDQCDDDEHKGEEERADPGTRIWGIASSTCKPYLNSSDSL